MTRALPTLHKEALAVEIEYKDGYYDKSLENEVTPLSEASLAYLIDVMEKHGRATALSGRDDFDYEFEYRMELRRKWDVEPAQLPGDQDEKLDQAWHDGFEGGDLNDY